MDGMAGQPKTREKKRAEWRSAQNAEVINYQQKIKENAVAVVKQTRRGAPSKFSDELFDEICAYLALGMSLKQICREIPGMPTSETIRVWLLNDRELSARYARAREAQADFLADELVEIADSVPVDRDAIEKAKLQSETRKWIAAKLKPKKYGDKLDLTSDGEALPTPITALQVNMPAGTQQLPPGEAPKK